jgi:hypothetical protein
MPRAFLLLCEALDSTHEVPAIAVPLARPAGIKEVNEGIWLVSFMHYDLGYFDLEQKTLQPLDSSFGTRLSPTSWVRFVTCVFGLDGRARLWRET